MFLRHGFGSIIDQIHLGRYIPFYTRLRSLGRWPAPRGLAMAERLRMAFGELGPSFIKLAQLLSTRPDLVGARYAEEFKKLQDRVPPFPVPEAKRIIEEEIRGPLGTAFSSFDDAPVAAASIAQVHHAELLDGSKVIVKVRRPGVREQLGVDIDILQTVAPRIEKFMPESKFFNPTGIVDEFQKTVRKELNFVEEGRNCTRFRRNFRDHPKVYIPAVYHEFTTERIIVMERIEGVRIDDVEAISSLGFDRTEIARAGIDAYFKMILEDGFFHADPHPGNIFVMPDGRLGLMDFGIVGRVSDDLKEILARSFMSFIKKDYDKLIEQYVELGIVPEEMDVGDFRRQFKADLEEFLEPMYGMTLGEIDFSDYMEAVVQISSKHHMHLPAELLLINKAMIILEDIGRRLDPDFDFIAASEPYVTKLLRERMNPARVLERTARNVTEYTEFLVHLPKHLKKLLTKALRDDLHMKMTIMDIDRLIKDMDRSSNRVAFAMVVSALLLSSAIMHATGVGPTIYGMSVMGFMVFGFAALLGVWLLISIFRSGRM